MHQSNDADDALNDVVMVVVNGEKRRDFLWAIHTRYFYLHCVLWVWGTIILDHTHHLHILQKIIT